MLSKEQLSIALFMLWASISFALIEILRVVDIVSTSVLSIVRFG
jgi:hypothetical protein